MWLLLPLLLLLLEMFFHSLASRHKQTWNNTGGLRTVRRCAPCTMRCAEVPVPACTGCRHWVAGGPCACCFEEAGPLAMTMCMPSSVIAAGGSGTCCAPQQWAWRLQCRGRRMSPPRGTLGCVCRNGGGLHGCVMNTTPTHTHSFSFPLHFQYIIPLCFM